MNIIIVGIGKVGSTILESLVREGHDVVAIDNNPNVIAEVSNLYDVMCVCGNGVDNEILTEAGAQTAQLLIAATASDEFNMLCCFMAKRVGTEHTVARIRNPEYNDQSLGFIRQQLDLAMAINPDKLAAKEFFNLLQLPDAANVETFSRRSFEIIELILKEGSVLDGISLVEMKKRFPAAYLVGTVLRGEEAIIPSGDFRLKSGDRIGLTGTSSELTRLLKLIGLNTERARNVMIIGASRISFYLTRLLISAGCRVTVIEKDPETARGFAEALPEAIVVCADGANEEILMEEGLNNADAFVTLTGIDEENILLSYLAQSHGVKKIAGKINRPEFYSLAAKLNLEANVSPSRLTSDVMTRYARGLSNTVGSPVETLYKLMDNRGEALEFKVREDFPAKNIPLRDLKLKKNTLLAGILRGRKVLIPTGNDVIAEGDSIVVLTTGTGMTDLADILEGV